MERACFHVRFFPGAKAEHDRRHLHLTGDLSGEGAVVALHLGIEAVIV